MLGNTLAVREVFCLLETLMLSLTGENSKILDFKNYREPLNEEEMQQLDESRQQQSQEQILKEFNQPTQGVDI
jgi:hypothetical protein